MMVENNLKKQAGLSIFNNSEKVNEIQSLDNSFLKSGNDNIDKIISNPIWCPINIQDALN